MERTRDWILRHYNYLQVKERKLAKPVKETEKEVSLLFKTIHPLPVFCLFSWEQGS